MLLAFDYFTVYTSVSQYLINETRFVEQMNVYVIIYHLYSFSK